MVTELPVHIEITINGSKDRNRNNDSFLNLGFIIIIPQIEKQLLELVRQFRISFNYFTLCESALDKGTVEPQSYGRHSYGILCQPDTNIEYIFGKYHKKFYKMGTGHQF